MPSRAENITVTKLAKAEENNVDESLETSITVPWIVVDGREGGGQLLRTSLAMSTLCARPFRMEHIRAHRPQSGLRAQHSTAAQAMTELCGATSTGVSVGSDAMSFAPTHLPSGEHALSIGTAGSTSLVLHTIFYPMALSEEGGSLQLYGGTHGAFAPTWDYLEAVWQPLLKQCGLAVEMELPYYGLYPRGGGQLNVTIPGGQRPLPVRWLERPALTRLVVRTLIAGPDELEGRADSDGELEEEIGGAAAEWLERMGYTVERELHSRKASSPGVLVYVFCEFGEMRAGFTVWSRKHQKASEALGSEVASLALRFLSSGAVLDEHAADQLLLPLSLAPGDSVFTTPEVTAHLRSNAALLEQFLPWRKIRFEECSEGMVKVSIEQKGPRPDLGLNAEEWEERTDVD